MFQPQVTPNNTFHGGHDGLRDNEGNNIIFLVMLEWFAVVHANVISTSAMFSTATCGFAHLIMGFRGLFVRVHMLIHAHTCKL